MNRSSGFDRSRTPSTSLPGPNDILRRKLANGITVLARENWSAPSVVVEGYLAVGSLDEPEGLIGLASFASGMLSRGTSRRTFAEINEMVESVGAAIGFGADRYVTSLSAKSLTEDLDLVLDVLADEIRRPAFPEEYVEKVRGQRLTAIAERENNTRHVAGKTFRELCFPDHPLGHSLLGDRETNGAIGRAALLEFYETYYGPEGMTIVVVGAVPAEQAVAKVESAFGDWSRSRPARAALPLVASPPIIVEKRVRMPEKSQADIIFGWPSLRRLDADYEAARMANTVLGVFGMMGRLGLEVRERGGMAYYAYSQLTADKSPGTWAVAAGVNPSNTERAIRASLDQVRRMCEELVPEEELEDSKRYVTGSLPLQLETNDGVASIIADLEWHELGLDYVQRYAGLVGALTPQQLQTVARKYLNTQAYVLAVAGP